MKKAVYLILTFVLTTCLLTACRNGSMNETSVPTTQGSANTLPTNQPGSTQNTTGIPNTTGDIIEDTTGSTPSTNQNSSRFQSGQMN